MSPAPATISVSQGPSASSTQRLFTLTWTGFYFILSSFKLNKCFMKGKVSYLIARFLDKVHMSSSSTIRPFYTVYSECIKEMGTSVVSWHCASPTRLSSRGRIKSSWKYKYSVLLIVQRTFMAFFVSCKWLGRGTPPPPSPLQADSYLICIFACCVSRKSLEISHTVLRVDEYWRLLLSTLLLFYLEKSLTLASQPRLRQAVPFWSSVHSSLDGRQIGLAKSKMK
jgi:hypothetical protein